MFTSNFGTLKGRRSAILAKYKVHREELNSIVKMLKNDHAGVSSSVIGQELLVTNDAPRIEGRISEYRKPMRRAGVDMITTESTASGLLISFLFAESYSLDGKTIGISFQEKSDSVECDLDKQDTSLLEERQRISTHIEGSWAIYIESQNVD